MSHKIIWLTGHSGAGKTTVAREIQIQTKPCIILDGNEMRSSISLGAGFSREDRTEHNLRVARLAKILSEQIMVFVAVIAPIKDVRNKITEICNPKWVYIKRTLPEKEGHFYEESDNYFTVNHDKLSVKESAKKILNEISKD